jgi:hypothetical protein
VSPPAYRRRPDVLWRRSLQAVLLLPPGRDDVVTVGGTGGEVWDLLDTWRSVDGLVELLAPRYEADPAEIARDVEALLGDLEALGALEMAAESEGLPTG